ncbi:sulfite exporter TauE/SafE family protein [Eubacteriaceae bacterium ES2]|nr:sulfite exporter TauE/SafE family protein [Eubacteriaceae bacterium ES2]
MTMNDTIMMDVSPLMIVAVICAYIVKGMCGFANTIVFTSILSFQNDNINITPVDLLIGIPSNILLAVRERKAVKLKLWLPLAALVLIGSLPGIFLLKYGDVVFIKILLGIVITGIGIEMLFREFHRQRSKSSPIGIFIIGLVSGFITGLFGIGALLAAYMGRTTDSPDAFRGNLCMVLLTDNLFRLIMYSVTGIITLKIVKNAMILFPFMLIGLGLGILLSKILDEKIVKVIIILMLIVSGLSLIAVNVP